MRQESPWMCEGTVWTPISIGREGYSSNPSIFVQQCIKPLRQSRLLDELGGWFESE